MGKNERRDRSFHNEARFYVRGFKPEVEKEKPVRLSPAEAQRLLFLGMYVRIGWLPDPEVMSEQEFMDYIYPDGVPKK